ncbi:mucin-5AC [Pimephales promelas]|uniref:mucin-5AC n=1 Tax=Pimephales promelas TaxID=90988 RepID=UPI001955C234|nr:mucin-5AC [Pimephales promelas]
MSTTGASPTTIETPMTESGATTTANIATTQTTAVVTSKLLFNSSSPVPSETLVLSALNTLLTSRQSQLNESVEVANFTYKKISETAYAIIITFKLNNISMSEVPELRNSTYVQVQDVINNALNTLLNEPTSLPLRANSSNFVSSSNQINGSMEYTFQDGDVIQPVSYLKELHSQIVITTTVSPESTTGSPLAPPNLTSGSAVVTSKLLFNSSSPVPSESLVLSAINTLLTSRQSQLNESVELANFTYQKISETSYAVVFTFSLINISMPADSDVRGNTDQRLQDIINNALNALLNEPGKHVFEPKSSNFTRSSNQINGNMEYTFQDGDAIKPVSFLNELRSQMELTTTTVSSDKITSVPSTSPSPISGSAVVTSKLLFNSSSPVPSETLVLSAINTLLTSRRSQLNESVEVANFTYQKISETSYAVVFTFKLRNISMSEDPELRNSTYVQVQDVINNALNTLLNEPTSPPLRANSFNFVSSSNQINGSMEYTFQDRDVIQPVSYLKELHSQIAITTTVSPESTTGSSLAPPNLTSGSAVVTSKLLFNSSSPVPSESLVLSALNTLLTSRQSQLNESVELANFTYQKISETSYAVVFTFSLINISMPADSDVRGNTDQRLQDIINNALNALLNEPGKHVFEPKSSNFTRSSNQINGNMEYTFQDGDAIQPVSFLNELRSQMELTTTTVSSDKITSVPSTSPSPISGSSVVTSKLLFNSSSPVPSETLVLSALNTLLTSRQSQLNESVEVANFTYQKISETSYAVVFTFKLRNISMSEDPELRNSTYVQVQDVINNALNTLLNEPTSPPLRANSFNFVSSSNQINGSMEYTFQDRDVIQPVSYLKELHSQIVITTTVSPESTTGSSLAPPNLTSGSAVVTSKLLFNSSSPVPSETLVLSAINTLLTSRRSQLNESVEVANFTYQKISETSYAVVFTFSLINISMPADSDVRGNTDQRLQDIINNALNALLNEPGKHVFEPKSSNFTRSSNQINGNMEYTFQDGDAIKPVSFLNELRSQMELTTTTVSSDKITSVPSTSPSPISGSAVVTSKLLFNSSSPVPSETLVLSAINTLLTSRRSQLNESVEVANFTYQKISETSYAVVFTFKLSNISMSEDPELRNSTYVQVQDVINNALNTLLNEPTSPPLRANSFNFVSSSNQINGSMEYTFQDRDVIQPVSYLKELHSQIAITTTVSPESTTGSSLAPPNLTSGSAVVTSKLLFNSSSPVPSETLVLSALNTLLTSRQSQLNESVEVANFTYQKISETSYAVVFTFKLSNISMSEDPELRNSTYVQVQDVINNALNTLLNEPTSLPLKANSSNFVSSSNKINGSMEYTFQDRDVIQPVSYLKELHSQIVITTTVSPESTTGSSLAPPNLTSGSAVVTSKLLFNSSSPVPSETLVLSALNTLLSSRQSQLNESVEVANFTYQKISETAYAIIITFKLNNISMSEVPELRNSTYVQVQDVINNALNTLLNEPTSLPLRANSSNFVSSSNQINGSMEYTFQNGDAIQPVSFLNELHSQLAITTTVSPESTTGSSLAPPKLISGSAVVTSKLLFNSSSPVPSETLVLSALNTLLTSRQSQLNESVEVANFTYQKISETAYAIIITFKLNNISMSEVPELRNSTYVQVQDVINNALNTLLNEPTSLPLRANSSNFVSSSNHINGSMEYTFQNGDAIQPVSFLNELHSQLAITTTVSSESTTGSSLAPPKLISGSAVVTSKLLFNSSSPVPSETLVLSALKSLLTSRQSQLNESVEVANFTYQKISETSYAVVFTFKLSNISMSEVPELRNSTYVQVQDVINNALNTLLNEPTSLPLRANSSNFVSSSNHINGSMEYTFQNGDAIQPVSFLNELHSLLVITTTVSPESTTGSSLAPPKLISGSAVVTSKLLFNSSSPVPSETLVLSALNTLLTSRQSQLNESVEVANFTYQKISETAYAIIITFKLNNISMSEVPELRNSTYVQVQDVINNALNTLLNEPTSLPLRANSSNFVSSSNHINGSMEYTFQNGDAIQPVSFLNELHSQMVITTTVSPESTTGSSLAPPKLISGSAVVTSKLLFNSSSPVPSETLVLSALKSLLTSRQSQLNESVEVANFTYQKISETAYAIIITFKLSNISMSEVPELRNSTYVQVQDVINNALNTLLNEPTSLPLRANSSNFVSSSNQINGSMEYTFQNGDAIQPVSFLNELHSQLAITTTVSPESTTGSSLAPPKLISGSAVVTSKLLFNSSSPVPSETLVLSALNTLLTSRQSQLNESVEVANFTYQKISETAYAIIITFKLSNISMSEVPELRNSTYVQVQDVINNALNTLLNEPTSLPLRANSSNFVSSSNQINGSMEYTFQNGDAIQPVSFLNELHSLLVITTTVSPESTTGSSLAPPKLISGSAVVTSKLLFNSSSPVPSETLVLNALNTLLTSRQSQLNESVEVANFTYQKISETAYAIIITFKLSNISMSEVPELRNSTYVQVQDVINNALNTLLNEPTSLPLRANSSNFVSSSNQINGSMEYTFQNGDAIQPVSFLNELHSQMAITTTVSPESTTGSSLAPPKLISGSAVVTSKLLFNSSSPVPSETLVLSALNTLLSSRQSQLNESVEVANFTYQKISETAYAIIITFKLSNISMSEVPELRNSTYVQVQDVINNALNTLLNEPTSLPLRANSSNFVSSSNQINGSMEYTFQNGDAIQPVSFLNELHSQLAVITTTVSPESTTGSSLAPPKLISGSAVVTSKLLFNSSSPVPSETLVLSALNTLLSSRQSQLNESVEVANFTYQKISETAYAIIITFKLSNISMSEVPELRNSTYVQVQDVINNALNTLLNEPTSLPLRANSSNFVSSSNQINGSMEYTFQNGDAIQPVSFLNELHSQLAITTTVSPESTTGSSLAPPKQISGSAVVTSKLLFNSSSSVPSETLVLSALNTLLTSRQSQLNESVEVANFTYQKISETAYAIIITFKLNNISMSEVPELRNSTYVQVQDVINNALNTLLNEPTSLPLRANSSNFVSSSNQINGSMEYTFQNGDAIQPVSFLNELHSQLAVITTTVSPESTTGSSLAPPKLIFGSAVVTSKLLFNSSSPVPSETLVLSALNTLLSSRQSQLNESVEVANFTYQKISETAYAIIITFKLSNISMSEVPELRNSTYVQVQDVINNALNTLLNEPTSLPLRANSSNFVSSSNHINGSMEYTFQNGDAIQPVSFLKELHSLLVITTTVSPESTTGSSLAPPKLISGSAVVTSKLLFNSSSPVPSETLVLNAIITLLTSRQSQLNESVEVANFTYQKISETSYAVVFTFKLSNISMSEDPELRNSTYVQVQDVINNALNTLLNEPSSLPLRANSSNFVSSSNHINGSMEYTFQNGDAIQPVSFLNELHSVLTTASTLTPSTTTPRTLLGTVIIYIRLVFVVPGPLPNEKDIMQVANNLLSSLPATKLNTKTEALSDPVSFVNVTYMQINESAYALNFGFAISNVTMSEKIEFRQNTYLSVQNSVNLLLNKILTNSSAPVVNFQPGDFTEFMGNTSTIQANVTYVFSFSNITQPSPFIQLLLQVNQAASISTTATTVQKPISDVIIRIRLEFVTLGPKPSESKVLRLINSLLASNLTTKQITKTAVIPNEPVVKTGVTYSSINETAYALNFEFEVSGLSVNDAQKNQAYDEIQKKINNLVKQILQNPTAAFTFIPANFTELASSMLVANVSYVFSERDGGFAAFGSLVSQLFLTFTTPAPTTIPPPTTTSNNGTNVAWIVAIIVPVAIVIGLIPCWILLCCLLCGCCAAVRRRWHRRKSYNVQYTTRNSLF